MRNKQRKGIICILLVFNEKAHRHYSTSGLPKEREKQQSKASEDQEWGRKLKGKKYKPSYGAVSI